MKCNFCSAETKTLKVLTGHSASICHSCIGTCMQIVQSKLPALVVEKGKDLTPLEIYAKLSEHVVGQEDAKKVLSVALYNHVLRQAINSRKGVVIDKSNVLLVGPTGSGKTYMAQMLADIANVPFTSADCTTLTEAGYVGKDVQSVLCGLLTASSGDINEAQRGIVYLDEFDKLASCNDGVSKDVSGEGVQRGLLRLIEGAIVQVPSGGYRSSITFDTSNVLFILGGAFSYIVPQLKKKHSSSTIGFSGVLNDELSDTDVDNLLLKLEGKDLVDSGFMPELVGRIPVIALLRTLSLDDLKKILVEPKNAIIKQYTAMLSTSCPDVKFTEEALEKIATLAKSRKTGARALRSILETSLLDIMFNLPRAPVDKLKIDDTMIKDSANAGDTSE